MIDKVPSTLEKIRILGANSKYDICASTVSSRIDKYPKLFGDKVLGKERGEYYRNP